jgi:hypothetical protein
VGQERLLRWRRRGHEYKEEGSKCGATQSDAKPLTRVVDVEMGLAMVWFDEGLAMV